MLKPILLYPVLSPLKAQGRFESFMAFKPRLNAVSMHFKSSDAAVLLENLGIDLAEFVGE